MVQTELKICFATIDLFIILHSRSQKLCGFLTNFVLIRVSRLNNPVRISQLLTIDRLIFQRYAVINKAENDVEQGRLSVPPP